jgi:hypothetical protein
MEEISVSCILETCNVQCNRALICTLIMCYYILLLLYYFNNIGLQVLPTYKNQCRRFSLINRDVPCNMTSNYLFAILYNAETCTMWQIYSVSCDSALNKIYCIFTSSWQKLQSCPASLINLMRSANSTTAGQHIFCIVTSCTYLSKRVKPL